jgi:cytochrome b561
MKEYYQSLSIKMDVCVYVCVCPDITLERLERFRRNLVHILLYVCFIYIPQGGSCGRQGIWMIYIVEEIKLLLLLGNRLKHIRGNVSYLVTWNVKEFTVGYSNE